MRTADQRCYEDAYGQRQHDYHTEQALRDCTESVDHADNEVVAKILADIGNRARWIIAAGDFDDKIAFVDFVCSNIIRLIEKYANDQAYRDVRHKGFEDTKKW